MHIALSRVVHSTCPLKRTSGQVRAHRTCPCQQVCYCGVLQNVAVCCSDLQCVAVCWSMLQSVGVLVHRIGRVVLVCCSVLQYVAVCCSVLQCVAVCCSVLQCVAVCASHRACSTRPCRQVCCCSVLQCVAVCCSVLQGVAGCCSVLQCVAVCSCVDWAHSPIDARCSKRVTSVTAHYSNLLYHIATDSHPVGAQHSSAPGCVLLQCVSLCCTVLQCSRVDWARSLQQRRIEPICQGPTV